MPDEIWVNDVDLSDFGFMASPVTKAWGDSPDLTNPSLATQGWPGPLWAGEPTLAQSRLLTIGGRIHTSPNAALLAAIDNMKALCQDGAVRLRFGDRPTQEYRGARCKAFSDTRYPTVFRGLDVDIAVVFELATPQRFDINPLGYALSTSRVSCPMGTAPSRPVVVLSTGGSATAVVNPVITVRSYGGEIIATMGFTGSIAQNDFWRIDMVRAQVTKSLAGVASDGISLWTSGDFFTLRPADAWYQLSLWPTVELSSSSGTPVGTISYTRQYL